MRAARLSRPLHRLDASTRVLGNGTELSPEFLFEVLEIAVCSRIARDSLRKRENRRSPTRALASATFWASRVAETFTVLMRVSYKK